MGTAPSLYHQNLFNNNVNVAGTTDRINSTSKIMAITFTSKGGTARKVSFYVHTKNGTGSTVYNIRVVKCLTSGTPSGADVSNTVTDLANASITNNKWVTVTFGSGFNLTEGSSYGIQIRGKTSQSSTQYIVVRSNTPLSTGKPDSSPDPQHNFWYYSGSAWTKRDRLSPFIVFDSANGYIDGHLHETGAYSLLNVDNNLSVGEKVKFSQPFTATSLSVCYDWATLSDPVIGNEPVIKIYNPSGTLLSSTLTTYFDAPAGTLTWRTYSLKTPYNVATCIYFDTSGYYTIIAKSGAPNNQGWYMGVTQSFVQTANPVSAQYLDKYAKWGTTWAYGISTSVSQENLWGTFKQYNNVTDGYYDMPFKLGYHIISGNVKNNLGGNFNGANVKIKNGTTVISSANTDSSGNFTINKFAKGSYRLQPYYNDWEFTPQAHTGTMPPVPTATFIQSSESKWWDEDSATGQGRHFAFRQKITFSTPHGVIPVGYVGTGMPLRTGDRIVLANKGEFNESMGWIASRGQYSFIAYRDDNAYHRIIKYDKTDGTYLETVVGFSGSSFDLHMMPTCEIDQNGIVHVFFSLHDGNVIPHYWSNQPYSISHGFSFANEQMAYSDPEVPNPPGTKSQTYLWAKYRETDKKIYVFFRAETGTHSYRGFIKQKDTGTGFEYGKYFARDKSGSGIYNVAKSIYCAGVYFDKNGYCYTALDYHYNYGAESDSRWDYSMNFYYSPDMITWHTINGTIVGYSTTHIGGNDDFWNYCSTSDGALWIHPTNPGPTGNHRGYNTDSLSLTNLKWNNGTHEIYLPFFGFESATGYLNPGQDLCIAYYSTTDSTWKYDNITKKTGIPFYLSRSGNFSVCKPSGEKMIFAMMNTSDALENPQWSNVEPVIFVSTSSYFGGDWTYKFIERNSMVGNGMMAIRNPHYYNNEVELIYAAGNSVVYYSDKNKYGYMRPDGNDIRIVYNNQEIPRVADSFNSLSSSIKFKIQKTLTAGAIFDTASNYYVYYGNQSTTSPVGIASANPSNIYTFFENFETYPGGHDLSDVSDWTKVSIGSSNDYAFRILSNTTSPVVDGGIRYFPAAYYTYSGIKSCLMGDSTYGQSTVYCEKTVGTNITDCWIEGHLRRHYAFEAYGYLYSFIGIKTASNTVYAIGMTSTISAGSRYPCYGYYNGTQWGGVSSAKICNYYWNSPMYMKVSSVNGTTFYNVTLTGTIMPLYTLSTAKFFNKMVFGGTRADQMNTTVFDFFRIYKI